MKVTLSLFKENLIKIYTSSVFYVSILGVLFVYAAGFIGHDFVDGTSYSVLSLLKCGSKERNDIIDNIFVDYQNILIKEPESYMWMFAGVLSCISFIFLMCSAKKNSNIRFELYRTSKWKYSGAKLMSAMFGGGSVLAAGYGLYCILLYFVVGTKYAGFSYLPNSSMTINIYKVCGFKGLVIIKIVDMFIFGMFSVLLPFVFSAFSQNKYMVICIPFMINYIICTLLSYLKCSEAFRIFSPMYFSSILFSDSIIKGSLVIGIYIIIALICYRVALGKRCDCGE